MTRGHKTKIFLLAVMVGIITVLHYATHQRHAYHHIFYRELYFVPIILAGFWYGLRGGLITSLSIAVVYLPLVFIQWQGLSSQDFDKLMEVLLFVVVGGVLGFISDRERAEQLRLREAERLAAMGKAVSTVAHDMKTPLVAIGGFARLVQKTLEQGDPGREKLDIVVRETQRLENMVKSMLDFSRPLELNRSHIDLNKVIEETMPVLEETAASREVKIETDLSPNLSDLELDRVKIAQVLINLVTNAVQASPQGQTVTIRSYREGEGAVLEVSDCGCGIPREQMDKIFVPFFSTKKEGTGLGLAIVKKIVEAHQGNLEVCSNSGTGVTFRVKLPAGAAN